MQRGQNVLFDVVVRKAGKLDSGGLSHLLHDTD